MIQNQSPLLTVREVADRLRISLATAYELVKRGAIASLRVGSNRGAIRIQEADLFAYECAMMQPTQLPEINSRKPVCVQLKLIKIR